MSHFVTWDGYLIVIKGIEFAKMKKSKFQLMIEIHPICEMFKYSHSILNSTYQGIFKTVLMFIPGAYVVNDKYWFLKKCRSSSSGWPYA